MSDVTAGVTLERRIVEDKRRTLAEWEELYRRRRMSERPGRDTDSLLQSLGGLEGMLRMLANPSNTASSNRRGRAKGYAPWSPRTRTRELIDNVREVLSEYEILLPLTIRQVFYRLVGVYGHPKDENAYERLCNALNRARRARMIGFEDLRDDKGVPAALMMASTRSTLRAVGESSACLLPSSPWEDEAVPVDSVPTSKGTGAA
jgi:hypothetical protein